MPLHDWTRVEDDVFHSFHTSWISCLKADLNLRLLPEGFYADSERAARPVVPDVLTLRLPDAPFEPPRGRPGGAAVLEAEPEAGGRHVVARRPLRRRVAVRRRDHQIVALIEILSAANKDREGTVGALADKVADALAVGIHVLVLDILPAGRHDPDGPHGALEAALAQADSAEQPFRLPEGETRTFAAYRADDPVGVTLRHPRLGQPLPEMPLFLTPRHHIRVPLEDSYTRAFSETGFVWRDLLEAP